MKTRPLIAIIGSASAQEKSPEYELARELGQKLVDFGYRICTGGLGGVMEAASRGAYESKNHDDGSIIGFLPSFETTKGNPYIDIPVATGLDIGRNCIIANSDAIVAIGGGAGTLSEMANAWALHRLIIAYRIRGWSGKLADTRIDERIRYQNIPDDRVYGVDTADETLKILVEKLDLYSRRHTGIHYP